MLSDPVEGLYEALVTRALREGLEALREQLQAGERGLDEETAPPLLARYIHDRVLQALRSLPAKERLQSQIELSNRLIELLAVHVGSAIDQGDTVLPPGHVLEWLRPAPNAGVSEGRVPQRPKIPLSASDLMVNGRHDVNVASEVRRELQSADRVDLLISFLKFSGVRILEDQLADFLRRRPGGLRVLTTVYTGATERRALDLLEELGADIKVSYDTQRTRLHAKAWLFHRDSTYSTAIIGSSNLSGAAILDGLEWNVRLSNVDNAGVLAKFQSTFDQYWADAAFREYEPEPFEEAIRDIRRGRVARLITKIDVRPRPHQEEILEALDAERERGHWRNLVVAATGTGKTIVAALDYRRLRREYGVDSLLFVAHRNEILDQSLSTFQVVLKDGGFGERLGSGQVPRAGRHVFASIQSLHADRLSHLPADAFDMVIVDEFHHAEAPTYVQLLEHLRPQVMLGLTATPERADGKSVLRWFDDRVAAEIRLWTAIDQGLLVPFQYFGVNDGTDLSKVGWRNGRYDEAQLTQIYTAERVWVQRVLQEVNAKVTDPTAMKALGFCVGIEHAKYMAQQFTEAGLPSVAVTSKTTDLAEREEAIRALESGELNALFTVDLFNEGVDIPRADTVLFLRPTESSTVFLQQLGRGLRLHEEKDCLTVLDFIGGAHRKFRFDLKFRAMLGGTRRGIKKSVEEGFPHLPAGCALRLDRHAQAAVLKNIQHALQLGHKALAEDLRDLREDVDLAEFLGRVEVEVEDVYARPGRCWSQLRREVGLPTPEPGPDETRLSKALARMIHVDDVDRLSAWRKWLSLDRPPLQHVDQRLMHLLVACLGPGRRDRPVAEFGDVLEDLWAHPAIRLEMTELLDVLEDRLRHRSFPLDQPDVPLRVHASYKLAEVMAAYGVSDKKGRILKIQAGVYYAEPLRTDLLFVTLQKSEKEYSPTTLYNDYPMSAQLFHWESQGQTREKSATGQRYINHERDGSRVMLFLRDTKKDDRGETNPYVFLGPVRYVRHQEERPMQIIWQLERPMPARFYEQVKVAAG